MTHKDNNIELEKRVAELEKKFDGANERILLMVEAWKAGMFEFMNTFQLEMPEFKEFIQKE